ncbi:hypothetical protein M231_00696 [Tremella mesenterica]|uniref:Uncharacterized protein n=1 Tax=Tremella mesenterica TaxID=5217 RepID=A0A4Q1BV38_TREME|nr:hypothetical protein M231_00696 [Tremella mesenterica]
MTSQIDAVSSKEFPLKPHNSPAVKVPGLMFCSGQLGFGEMADATIESLTKLKSVLEIGGSSLEKVVKFNVLIGDIEKFDEFNNAFMAFTPTPKPARTCTQAGRLWGGAAIEIECIAQL